MATYDTALNKISTVQNEQGDGLNTAYRVGDAMKEALDYTKGKPDSVDITDYETSGAILPLSSYYTHGGKPTYSRIGTYDSTDFLAIIVATWGNSNPNTLIYLYTKDNQNLYRFNSTFYSNDDDLTNMEAYVVAMVAGTPVSYTRNGLMTADDKMTFDEMVTEVFPLTVGVVSSNAGSFEVGTSVTPNIVLSITRKGVDVPAADITENITPNPAYISPDKRTISGNQVSSGTTTYQIAVTQGGQTKSAPNQVFDFMNYLYYGETSSKPANATAVATLCENGSLGKQLSRATTKSSTNLAANRYYVFAVKGRVNLVCRHAGTDAVVTGCTTGTATLQRVNNSGGDSYSYIIVEKSNSAWSFKITNS